MNTQYWSWRHWRPSRVGFVTNCWCQFVPQLGWHMMKLLNGIVLNYLTWFGSLFRWCFFFCRSLFSTIWTVLIFCYNLFWIIFSKAFHFLFINVRFNTTYRTFPILTILGCFTPNTWIFRFDIFSDWADQLHCFVHVGDHCHGCRWIISCLQLHPQHMASIKTKVSSYGRVVSTAETTVKTMVRFLSSVCPHMNNQVILRLKISPAIRTNIFQAFDVITFNWYVTCVINT